MSREIKFRAWQGDHFLYYASLHELLLDGYAGANVNLDSVQLYTGLHDKNGVEIYEGDVVYDEFNDKNAEVKFYADDIDSCGRFYEQFLGSGFAAFSAYDSAVSLGLGCEVIGNVYESPHLLQGKQQ